MSRQCMKITYQVTNILQLGPRSGPLKRPLRGLTDTNKGRLSLVIPLKLCLVHNCFDHVKMWVELEKCVDLGLIRHIGLSNFDNDQVKNILDNCRIKPFNNQVEIHPWIDQSELVDFHFQNQIRFKTTVLEQLKFTLCLIG